jgi:hypothetical protein
MKFSATKMLYFFLLLPVFYFTGCCSNPVRYVVSNDLKRYFDFPEGSYWIYKNYNNYDTLKVLGRKTINEAYDIENCDEKENIVRNYYSSYLDTIFETYTVCIGKQSYFKEYAHYFTSIPSDSSDHKYVIVNDYTQKTIANLKIGNQNYTDIRVQVLDTMILGNSVNKNWTIEGYYVKDIGLVKRVLYDGTNWELVDYKIYK